MVTSLQDVSNTKENYPSVEAVPQPTNRGMKNTFGTARPHTNLNDKKKRTDAKGNKDQGPPSPAEPIEMNQAFDQLLVSSHLVNLLNFFSHFCIH